MHASTEYSKSIVSDDPKSVWEGVDVEGWRTVPFISGRLASEEDVKEGRAVFYVHEPHSSAKPAAMPVPSLATLRSDGAELQPIIVVQAELHNGSEILIGYRDFGGGTGICTGADLDFVDEGNDSGALRPGLTLRIENRAAINSPTLQELLNAIDAMTPDGGPGFLVIETSTGDYAQAAGGQNALTVEWRQYSAAGFSHWVAGRPGEQAKSEIRIATNGAYLTVNYNECLDCHDARTIFQAFATARPRPATYEWRDITAQFISR